MDLTQHLPGCQPNNKCALCVLLQAIENINSGEVRAQALDMLEHIDSAFTHDPKCGPYGGDCGSCRLAKFVAASVPKDFEHYKCMINQFFAPQTSPDQTAAASKRAGKNPEKTTVFDRKVVDVFEELSKRAVGSLTAGSTRSGDPEVISTVRELVMVTEAQMLRRFNTGHKTVNEFKECLAGHGLHFGMTEEAVNEIAARRATQT